MKTSHIHLAPERIQALLDGDLPAREARALRAEAESCPRCRAEIEAWEVLFQDLGSLPVLAPSGAFRERVMEHLPAQRRQRVLAGLFGRRDARSHATGEELQEHLDGRLAARESVRLEEHLDRCGACRREMDALHAVATELEALPVLAPAPGFGEAVMARLRVQQMARVALSPTTRRERVAAWVRARIPSSGRGWAAVAGVGTAPAVTLALVVQAVFSHEAVTLANLFAFFRFKLSAAADTVGGLLAQWTADYAAVARIWDVAQTVASSPALAAATVAWVSVMCMGAVWVLYRNLVLPGGEEGAYAQARR